MLWEMDLIEGIKTRSVLLPYCLAAQLWEMDLIEGIKTIYPSKSKALLVVDGYEKWTW